MSTDRTSRGVQSIEVGGTLLQALVNHGRALPLKDLAAAAGMSPAKAHAYLVSFARSGLVSQDGDGGPYDLGPLAISLGLISLQRADPIRLASAALEPLAHALQATAAVAVWGQAGPTVVRVAEAPLPVFVSLRHGTVLNLAQTATGQVFAAYRDDPDTTDLWRAQGGTDATAWAAHLAQVRAQGHALSDAGLVPGVSALAVPVLDALGACHLVLLALAPSAQWPAAPRARALKELQKQSAALQRQMGAGVGLGSAHELG